MSHHDRTNLYRRRFIELAVGTVAVASGSLKTSAGAAELPHLSPTDPAAEALGYQLDTRKVPAAKYPNHKPAQHCGICNFYRGAAGAEWGPCLIFPGKEVHVRGWCSAFAPKQ